MIFMESDERMRSSFSQGLADWSTPIDQIQPWEDRILGRPDCGIIEGKYCSGAIGVKKLKIHEHIVSSHNRSLF